MGSEIEEAFSRNHKAGKIQNRRATYAGIT
jgi:hypothetical protein